MLTYKGEPVDARIPVHVTRYITMPVVGRNKTRGARTIKIERDPHKRCDIWVSHHAPNRRFMHETLDEIEPQMNEEMVNLTLISVSLSAGAPRETFTAT